MQEHGFISDKLEIKLLILYIASRLVEPAPFEVLQELSLCDGGVDYFNFSECLADLVRTEHLELREGRYAVTEKGRRNSAACESGLPYAVRLRAEQNLAVSNEQLKRQALVHAGVREREGGGYTVELSMSDELDSLMRLEVLVTRRELAMDIRRRFQDQPEEIYAKILAVLCGKDGGTA